MIATPWPAAFLPLWRHYSPTGGLPLQRAFTPQDLAPYEQGLSIADFDLRLEVLSYQQASPSLIATLGRNPAGRPVHTCYRGQAWLAVWQEFRYVIDREKAFYSREDGCLETLYLPVQADNSSVSRIFVFTP